MLPLDDNNSTGNKGKHGRQRFEPGDPASSLSSATREYLINAKKVILYWKCR